MGNSITNLKAVADYFGITNKALAKAINVDQSVVSRWMTGKRQLRVSSGIMEPIADFILSRQLTSRDLKWLKKHFEKEGLSTHFNSASDIKMNLIIWLAADGMEILNNLGKNSSQTNDEFSRKEAFSSKYQYSIGPAGRIYSNDYSVKTGTVDIALRLEHVFSTIAEGSIIDICLSGENMSVVIEDAIVDALVTATETGDIHIRMMISISSNSFALSKIISSYMRPIVKAKMKVYVVHAFYFMETGALVLDTADCMALLKGYIKHLKAYSNYNLAIAEKIDEQDAHSCRHIKHSRHVAINGWKRDEPILVYSDQMILLHEFQTHFNQLWMCFSLGTRENTIAILDVIIEKLAYHKTL